MPRIFTHLENHAGYERDIVGRDVPSLDRAIAEAGRTAGGALADDVAAGRTPISITLYLETESDERLATVRVAASVEHD